MQKTLWIKTLSFLLIIQLFTCSQSPTTRKLTIAAAANMQFAMTELVDKFSAQTGIACELVVGSSGKLTAQIKEGAPYDVFISADMKYPTEISRSGLAETAPKIYAYGALVLWSMEANTAPSLELLASNAVQHIALANPKTAPYGAAAVELLQYYQHYEQVKSKLVFGESIAQTNQFISSGAAEIGFTAKSVVLSPKMQGKGRWISLDQASYRPIEQGIVIIKQQNGNREAALTFYEFIFSETAAEILTNFGYSIHE